MRRRMLFALAIVLLLRGWAAEAMAGQMLAHQLQASSVTAAAIVHPPDCPGAALMEASADDGQENCGSCLQCQDCSLNALPSAMSPVTQVQAPPPALAAARSFTSAEPLLGFKPPTA